MNNENFHPVLKEPPIAHALHKWDPKTGILTYEYNGINVIEIDALDAKNLGFRHGSDGTLQSIQYLQQIYLASDEPVDVNVKIRLNKGSLVMRPHRAAKEQAILGSMGGGLIYGANGIYDPNWDLLIDWRAKDWDWLSSQFIEEDDDMVTATFQVSLSLNAMFINLRPGYYRRHLGYNYFKPWETKTSKKEIAGWCSWEAFRRNISMEKIESIAAFLKQNFEDYGLNYLQVDDGYQEMPLPKNARMTMDEGWMTCEKSKFPGGHESIVDCIKQAGLLPAIWVNANITNPDFPVCHHEDVIWYEGKPLKGEWIDYLYSCTEDNLNQNVVPIFERLKKKGYQYIKIDAIRHLLLDGLHECVRLGILTNDDAEQKFRAFLMASRKGMGEDVYYLASWGEMHEVVGVCDACRISMDANPTWAGIRMQLFESARWYHTQRILFLNDPDHVCVRTNKEWAKSILSLISLSGELYMLSDTVDAYTPDKIDIIQKTLPPLTMTTAETGPLSCEYPAYTWTKLHGFAVQSHETPVEMEQVSLEEAMNIAGNAPDLDRNHPFSSLWSFQMNHHNKQWQVVLRVATIPLKESQIPMEKLALNPNKTYIAFDFWEQKYLGEVKGTFTGKALELGCCQVIAFYEKREEPMVIASDRHVSMDAVSILDHSYNPVKREFTIKVEGIVGKKTTYFIKIPKLLINSCNFEFTPNISYQIANDMLILTVEFNKKELEVCIKF